MRRWMRRPTLLQNSTVDLFHGRIGCAGRRTAASISMPGVRASTCIWPSHLEGGWSTPGPAILASVCSLKRGSRGSKTSLTRNTCSAAMWWPTGGGSPAGRPCMPRQLRPCCPAKAGVRLARSAATFIQPYMVAFFSRTQPRARCLSSPIGPGFSFGRMFSQNGCFRPRRERLNPRWFGLRSRLPERPRYVTQEHAYTLLIRVEFIREELMPIARAPGAGPCRPATSGVLLGLRLQPGHRAGDGGPGVGAAFGDVDHRLVAVAGRIEIRQGLGRVMHKPAERLSCASNP